MDNEAVDFTSIKGHLDTLYQYQDTLITDLPDDVSDVYNVIVGVMKVLERDSPSNYNVVIDMIREYEDKNILPGTVGEYLFGCVTMTEADKCVKDCNGSIKDSNSQFSKCSYPVYRIEQYGLMTLIYNDNLVGGDTAVVLLNPNEGLSNDAVTTLRTSGYNELHVYNRANNRYEGKYTLVNGTYVPALPTEPPVTPVGKTAGKPKKKGKNGKQDYWRIVAIVIGGIAIIGGLYYFMNNKKSKGTAPSSSNGSPLYSQVPRQVPRQTRSVNNRRCFQFNS